MLKGGASRLLVFSRWRASFLASPASKKLKNLYRRRPCHLPQPLFSRPNSRRIFHEGCSSVHRSSRRVSATATCRYERRRHLFFWPMKFTTSIDPLIADETTSRLTYARATNFCPSKTSKKGDGLAPWSYINCPRWCDENSASSAPRNYWMFNVGLESFIKTRYKRARWGSMHPRVLRFLGNFTFDRANLHAK